MRLQIDCIEWVLEKIEVNKVPNDRLDGLIQKMIKDLEKRKDKAMNIGPTRLTIIHTCQVCKKSRSLECCYFTLKIK